MTGKLDVTIRKPTEYAAIARCIAEARGPRYYSAKYYDPAYLLNGGEHELFAAYDEQGEMAGFTGISAGRFDDSRSVLSLLNIRTCYTGNGVAARLVKHSAEALCGRGVKAVKTNVVTRHTSVQNMVESLELVPTGFLYGVRDGRNAEPVINGKCALTVHVRNLSVRDAGDLYLHREIADFGRDVYNSLGAAVRPLCEGSYGQTSVMEHEYDGHDSVLFVQVSECGEEIAGELRKLVRRYHSPSMTAIVLLNLGSPSAIYGYGALRDAGWRFSGFDPLGRFENAVFFSGNAVLADMKLTERTKAIYEKLHF